jgi:hypothetical protein
MNNLSPNQVTQLATKFEVTSDEVRTLFSQCNIGARKFFRISQRIESWEKLVAKKERINSHPQKKERILNTAWLC